MELKIGENIGQDVSLPIIVTSETEIKSFIKGYHAYKHLWNPFINEQYSYETLVTWLISTQFV